MSHPWSLLASLSAVTLLPFSLGAQVHPAGSRPLGAPSYLVERVASRDSGLVDSEVHQVAPVVSGPAYDYRGAGMPGLAYTGAVPWMDTLAYIPKSASTAFLLSFLIAGGGQLYAGETKKGVVLMAMELVGSGLVIHELATCDNVLGSECADAKFWSGGVLALGSWIFSMVDAPGAARRYNEKYGRAQPIVDIEPGRAARFGVSVELGR